MSNLPGSPAAKHLAVDLVTATQHIIISGLQEITDLRSCRPDQLDYLIEVLIHCYDLMKHLNDFSYMSLGRRHGEWKNRGHVAASRYEVLTSTPGITPQFASQILDAISIPGDEYSQSGEDALDRIFQELQQQILP